MDRRGFLKAGFALTPIAAALSALAGCGRASGWPEGMAEIKWDRDTCARCKMVVSDRRFAVEARGGAKDQVLKFDDIGCAVFWLRDLHWDNDPATRIWVADATARGDRWLDARKAQYVGGRTSPMGYNFGAVATPQAGSLDFAALREHILALGR